ncbi:dTDP-4-dehydrorhamnose 3,5-epimerase [Anaerocellum danielii]|uniref:dTDP-4-dehydrorhamnose 3,5-epimerase n=1 Tax=Anaerocellum danielii TaxID=1387557 RepID=A0ABZ0U043_9FIRM|nr:dTDP-4-dehydrorhamnose 3,5-epimerase [Caldicellulosiruptor danielii]WPX07799.1 dTDP-4-dehydrorhamnose 3,5-epimerase [Caldicellulosiruptor danielii]
MYTINKTKLPGCVEIIPNIFDDHRGTSIKLYHSEIFKSLGIKDVLKEVLCVKSHKNVLRGLHYQKPPFCQAKLVSCLRGSIFDVVVDIRENSPTYGKFECFHIDSKKNNIVYVPVGFAHGYLVLEDDTIVLYNMSEIYSPEHEGGIRWDSLSIPWPIKNPILSDKDMNLPPFNDSIRISLNKRKR